MRVRGFAIEPTSDFSLESFHFGATIRIDNSLGCWISNEGWKNLLLEQSKWAFGILDKNIN